MWHMSWHTPSCGTCHDTHPDVAHVMPTPDVIPVIIMTGTCHDTHPDVVHVMTYTFRCDTCHNYDRKKHLLHSCISYTAASPTFLYLLHSCISYTPPPRTSHTFLNSSLVLISVLHVTWCKGGDVFNAHNFRICTDPPTPCCK